MSFENGGDGVRELYMMGLWVFVQFLSYGDGELKILIAVNS